MSSEAPEKSKNIKKEIMEWVIDIVVAIIIALAVSMVIKPTVVKENSMEPNFHADDYVLINKLAYKFGGEPKHGDVIIFRSDSDMLLDDKGKHKLLIKRVIGVPGDKISIYGGQVYINGKPDDQSYTEDGETHGDISEMEVPDDSLFCLGDNREVSIDSRSEEVGFIDQDSVVGKAFFRVLPLSDIGTIKNVYE